MITAESQQISSVFASGIPYCTGIRSSTRRCVWSKQHFAARQQGLRGVHVMLTLSRAVMLPSHYANRVGTPKEVFEALYPAHQCLCLRFAPCLAANCARLEVRMVRYSFPV